MFILLFFYYLFLQCIYAESSFNEYKSFSFVKYEKLIGLFPLDFDISNAAHYFDSFDKNKSRHFFKYHIKIIYHFIFYLNYHFEGWLRMVLIMEVCIILYPSKILVYISMDRFNNYIISYQLLFNFNINFILFFSV